jgi:hypothetical protein
MPLPKLCNAFSLSMLTKASSESTEWLVRVEKISLVAARTILAGGFDSYVGHPDTAVILSKEEHLNIHVPESRGEVTLNAGDMLVVAQYGQRLEKGATVLPPDAKFYWLKVTLA